MPQSFSPSVGGTISDGDTQPLGSWVYKEFAANAATFSEGNIAGEAYGAKEIRTSSPPQTLDDGTSQIDLMGAFDGGKSQANNTNDKPQPYDSLALERGGFMPVTPGPVPNHLNFSEEVQNLADTPRLPFDIFGRKGATPNGIMPLSQLFKQTQAPTSPVQHGPFSDPERPSPDIHRKFNSPGLAASSSPLMPAPNRMRHIIGEPSNDYVSMKDSQAERDRQQHSSERDNNSSDDEFDSWEERQARRRRQAKIDAKNTEALKAITVPRRHSSEQAQERSSGRVSVQREAENKANSQRSSSEPVDGNSDTENEGENGLQSDPDEQDIDRTEVQIPDSTNRDRNHQVTNSHETPTVSRHSRSTSLRANASQRRFKGVHQNGALHSSSYSQDDTVQTFAVADSQPSISAAKSPLARSSPPPPDTPALPSSVGSSLFVSQSQPDIRLRDDKARKGEYLMPANIISSSLPPPLTHSSPTEKSTQYNNDRLFRVSDEVKDQERRGAKPMLQKGGDNQGPNINNIISAGTVPHHPAPAQLPGCHGNWNTPSGSQCYSSSVDRIDNTNTTIPETSPASSRYPQQGSVPEVNKLAVARNFSSRAIKDSVESAETDSFSTSKRFSFLQGTGNSDFETAKSHIMPSIEQGALEGRNPLLASEFFPRPRRMGEIAASPTPPRDSLPEIDLDISVMSEQDHEFQRVIEGSSPVAPSRKRRRVNGRVHVASEIDSDPVMSSDPIQAPMDAPQEQIRENLEEELPGPTSNKPEPLQDAASSKNAAYPKRGGSAYRTKLGKSNAKKIRPPQNLPPAARNPDIALDQQCSGTETLANGREQSEPHFNSAAEQRTSTYGIPNGLVDVAAAGDEQVQAPDRVFAFFNGKSLPAFYPASCLSVSVEPKMQDSQYEVRFDDGSLVALESHKLRSLDLRVGDLVKVDFPNLRKQNYVVAGFRERMDLTSRNSTPAGQTGSGAQGNQRYPITDIRGYSTVALVPKIKESGNQRSPLTESTGTISVPIGSIYITNSMFAQFKDRLYTPSSRIASRPSPAVETAGPTTPSSRSRRTTLLLQSASIKSAKSEISRPTSNLFSGMAFAVTFVDDDDAKKRIVRHIADNGGRLLVDGFDELFHIDSLEAGSDSAAARPSDSPNPFRLTPEAEKLGFVCLITDRHSRRAKYIQALALGLPCLAGRWIDDCISKTRIIDWQPYLLPSGESSFLGGAIHSRILQPYPADTATFAATVDARPRLLSGRSVLLVMGKGKAEERRKAYLFLTYALGARRVSRAPSLDAAKQVLIAAETTACRWDWVYVDEKDKGVENVLWSGNNSSEKPRAGRKRRRGEALPLTTPFENNVKIVGDEFVVQSLILGKLLEE
ncbi:hypothetical protein L228DRAFT_250060 [Xylona heveae TC161]|uniref:BRCT domain-containing protein n=1 Tax=Xylona heveae (strain CBS 132557 / TC161) TaxID=1328760 RepID=A0A165AF62_XYLHT|nr:hypothetical protein L228DRAFT_250060 [Xylona heveae TC161]KZF20376.1 hypothetical protein L228DRAFT_250060 [Xylona heveae TC161]